MKKSLPFRTNGRSIILLITILTALIVGSCQKEELTTLSVDEETEMDSPQLKSASVPDYLLELIETIEIMVADELISEGKGNALISKIENAIKSIEKGNTNAVDGQLGALINEVEDLVDNGILTEEQGESLINVAEYGIIFPDGSFIDPRDGNEYSVVLIGDQIWMAENLAFDIGEECWIYDNDDSNLGLYGRLYTWNAAKSACPSGWHLSTDNEWEQLAQYISDQQLIPYVKDDDVWPGVGQHLKSTFGWNNNGNGIDDYGFSALPGGYWEDNYGYSLLKNYTGFWWTSTEYSSGWAWGRYINCNYPWIVQGRYNVEKGLSVRCIKD